MVAVLSGEALVFVFLKDSDLATAEDGLEREADEEFGGGREECGEGVGGWCNNGVNGEEGAEEERR